MLKKSSSQEPLGHFQPNLVGNMLWGGGGIYLRFIQIKGWPIKGQNKEYFYKFSKLF